MADDDTQRALATLSLNGDGGATYGDDVDIDDEDDIDMPFGANEENQELHRMVKEMERKAQEMEVELDTTHSRITSMDEHLKNVRQEEKMTDAVIDAKRKEIESESQIAQLAANERKQLEREAKSMQQNIANMADSQNTYQNDIFKFQTEIDELRQQMDWDEQQLNTWMEKAKQKEEDAEILEKYALADEARVKELRLQLESLNVEAKKAKRLLDQEVMNTKTHEIGLDKVAELYKAAHEERNQIIAQWEQTMKMMQTEDVAIEEAAEKFQSLKTESSTLRRSIVEEKEFCDNEKESNNKRSLELDKMERVLTRLNDEKEASFAELTRFQTELESLRGVNARVATDEIEKQRDVEQMKEAIAMREDEQANLEKQVATMERKIKNTKKSNLSAEEQMSNLEAEATAEAQRERKSQKHLELISKELAKKMQTAHELESRNALAISGISGVRQSEKNIQSRIRAMERQQLQEQQIMYKQDFQITVLERKLLRMKGTLDDEEEAEILEEIKALKETLAEHTETNKLLSVQLRKVDDATRLSKRRRDDLKGRLHIVQGKLADTELFIKGSGKQLDITISEKQNLMVEDNLLKLEVRRLRKRLNAKADDVLSLEQRKLQLKIAMDERLHEVATHKDLLNVQKIECARRKAAVAKEREERRTRIDQLKKKHDIVSFAMKGPEGEEQSQAYLIIKIAQEKQALQQEGDELDSKIRKREKEIRMLDNTLHLMNGHNQKYRDSLKKVDAESEDAATKEHLEGQLRTAMDKYKHKRRELKIKQEELEEIQEALDNCRNEVDKARLEHSMLQGQLQNVEHELGEQHGKLDRAAARAAKMIASFRKDNGGPENETVAEKDFRLKQIKKYNVKIMDEIDQIVAQFPDLRPMVSMLYDRAGIARPVVRPGTGSSRGSSRASSYRSTSTRSTTSRASSRASVTSSRVTSSRGVRSKPATSQEAASAHQARGKPMTPKTVQLGLGL